MIDIGVNLSNVQFKTDIEIVIKNAKEHGVSSIILTSTNFKSYLENLDIIKKFQEFIHLTTTFGVHPHQAESDTTLFNNINELINPNIVAIGEFGLDYYRQISSINIQRLVMEKHIEIGAKYPNLPFFLHERQAFDDFVNILNNQSHSNNKVVHCFTGNKEQVKKYLDLNCFIGITGWITDKRRNQELIEAIKYIPIDKIMIETDSPYLTPKMKKTPIRNEPKYLHLILDAVAFHKNLDKEKAKLIIQKNTIDFFNFKI